LRVPILNFFDGWHFAETIGQFAQVLDSMGESNGELLGEELGGAEESAWRGLEYDNMGIAENR